MSGGVLRRLRRADPLVIAAATLLALLGLALIASASESGSEALHLTQLKWLALALAVAGPLVLVPYPRIVRHALPLYAAGIALLVLVKLTGPVINGAQRWIVFGGGRLQPSEPMKVFTILALARILRFGRPLVAARQWAAPLVVAALPVALVAVEPDLGTSLLFVPLGVATLVVSGIPMRSLGVLLLAGALLAAGGAAFVLKPYQKERILSTFQQGRLTPTQQVAEGYQLHQSLLAVGNGGWTGHGHGEGPRVQSGRLPHHHNDFIFAVLAEEHGFLGGTAAILLVLLLVHAVFRVARRARDPAGRVLCVGVGTLLGAQAMIHVAVTLGLAPTTGMPFPLVSYGGSALLTTVAALALVLNVSIHRPAVPLPSAEIEMV